jgi:hypothetical protein
LINRRVEAQLPTGRNAYGGQIGRYLQDQLVARRVKQPDRAALGVQHALRRVHHLDQHLPHVKGRREAARDGEDRLEIARLQRKRAALGVDCAHRALA